MSTAENEPRDVTEYASQLTPQVTMDNGVHGNHQPAMETTHHQHYEPAQLNQRSNGAPYSNHAIPNEVSCPSHLESISSIVTMATAMSPVSTTSVDHDFHSANIPVDAISSDVSKVAMQADVEGMKAMGGGGAVQKDVTVEHLEFDGNTVLCRVCGDKASGFHYGVHACEGCKGFFRRSIQQKIQYRPCLKNQMCNIMRVNRNRCQYCRLRKCIAVGMSRDAVRFGRVPKREKAKIMEQMQKVNAQVQGNLLNEVLDNSDSVIQHILSAHMQTCEFTRSKFITLFEKAWEQPKFVDCPAHMACPLNPSPDRCENIQKWDEFSNCFTPAIRSVVNFAKSIPGFSVFSQEDQVTLLKAGTFEVLLVHLACLFDTRTNTMMFTNGNLYRKLPQQGTTSAGFLLDSMFDFADRLNQLRLTDEELALFSAMVIIAQDRPGLRYQDQVQRVHSLISQGLQTLMKANHPSEPAAFSKLLMKIPDLRTLNTLHSEKLLGLTVPQTGSGGVRDRRERSSSPPGQGPSIKQGIPQIPIETCPISKSLPAYNPHGSGLPQSNFPSQFPPHGMIRCPVTLPEAPPSSMNMPSLPEGHRAPGQPIVPHQVQPDSREKELILQTPIGAFHRSAPSYQGLATLIKMENEISAAAGRVSDPGPMNNLLSVARHQVPNPMNRNIPSQTHDAQPNTADHPDKCRDVHKDYEVDRSIPKQFENSRNILNHHDANNSLTNNLESGRAYVSVGHDDPQRFQAPRPDDGRNVPSTFHDRPNHKSQGCSSPEDFIDVDMLQKATNQKVDMRYMTVKNGNVAKADMRRVMTDPMVPEGFRKRLLESLDYELDPKIARLWDYDMRSSRSNSLSSSSSQESSDSAYKTISNPATPRSSYELSRSPYASPGEIPIRHPLHQSTPMSLPKVAEETQSETNSRSSHDDKDTVSDKSQTFLPTLRNMLIAGRMDTGEKTDKALQENLAESSAKQCESQGPSVPRSQSPAAEDHYWMHKKLKLKQCLSERSTPEQSNLPPVRERAASFSTAVSQLRRNMAPPALKPISREAPPRLLSRSSESHPTFGSLMCKVMEAALLSEQEKETRESGATKQQMTPERTVTSDSSYSLEKDRSRSPQMSVVQTTSSETDCKIRSLEENTQAEGSEGLSQSPMALSPSERQQGKQRQPTNPAQRHPELLSRLNSGPQPSNFSTFSKDPSEPNDKPSHRRMTPPNLQPVTEQQMCNATRNDKHSPPPLLPMHHMASQHVDLTSRSSASPSSHQSAISTLKDKILKRIDSQENLARMSPNHMLWGQSQQPTPQHMAMANFNRKRKYPQETDSPLPATTAPAGFAMMKQQGPIPVPMGQYAAGGLPMNMHPALMYNAVQQYQALQHLHLQAAHLRQMNHMTGVNSANGVPHQEHAPSTGDTRNHPGDTRSHPGDIRNNPALSENLSHEVQPMNLTKQDTASLSMGTIKSEPQ